MMKGIIAIKSVKELCNMNLKALEKYGKDVAIAEKEASTDFEREAYTNQLRRVNTAINEKKLAAYLEYQDKKFKSVIREIHESVTYAERLRGSMLFENQTNTQDKQTGTSSQPCVATAEGPNLEEIV